MILSFVFFNDVSFSLVKIRFLSFNLCVVGWCAFSQSVFSKSDPFVSTLHMKSEFTSGIQNKNQFQSNNTELSNLLLSFISFKSISHKKIVPAKSIQQHYSTHTHKKKQHVFCKLLSFPPFCCVSVFFCYPTTTPGLSQKLTQHDATSNIPPASLSFCICCMGSIGPPEMEQKFKPNV